MTSTSGLSTKAPVPEDDAPPSATSGVFDVDRYGAKGDGKTPDTAAIQSAIDACSATGGGTVLLPAGRYLSGTLRLAGNLRLEIAAGATLVGSANLDDYACPGKDEDGNPLPDSRWHRALLRADNAANLTLCGNGTIDGGKPVDPQGEEKVRGPHLFVFDNCSNVVIEDVTFLDAGNYAVFFTASDDVSVRRARFRGGYDGVHFRGRPDRPCRRVSSSDCDFQTGDDSIAGMHWEGVDIKGCKINSSCNGLRLIGPASDLTVSHCDFHGPGHYEYRTTHRHYMLAAFCLQPGAWGDATGTLDRIRLSDCTVQTVTTPFHFVLKPGNEAKNITVERIVVEDANTTAISVESWSEKPFSNVVFRDVSVSFTRGTVEGLPPPDKVRPPGVDARDLPVWGFYARNVESLVLDNVKLVAEKPDTRPMAYFDNVGHFTWLNQAETGKEGALL